MTNNKIKSLLTILALIAIAAISFSAGYFVKDNYAIDKNAPILYAYNWTGGIRPVESEYGLSRVDIEFLDKFRRPLPNYTGNIAEFKNSLKLDVELDYLEKKEELRRRLPDVTERELLLAYVILRANNIYNTYKSEHKKYFTLTEIVNSHHAECIKYSLAAAIMLEVIGGFDSIPVSFASPAIQGHTVLQVVNLQTNNTYLLDVNNAFFARHESIRGYMFFEAIYDNPYQDGDLIFFKLPHFIKHAVPSDPESNMTAVDLNKKLLLIEEDYRQTLTRWWSEVVRNWTVHEYSREGLFRERSAWIVEGDRFFKESQIKYSLPNKISQQ